MVNKYKIGVGINYWDDPYGLINLLETPKFLDIINIIYLIDGKYKGRDDSEEYDNNLTQTIVKKYNNKIYYIKKYNVTQIEKRNIYWELAEKDNLDLMFVLDSDEYIEFKDGYEEQLDRVMEFDAQCFPITESWEDISVETPRPRLFKKPFNFRHKINTNGMISHGSLWNEQGREIINDIYRWFSVNGERLGVPKLNLIQTKRFRSKKRVDADYVYYANNPLR
jgi:hypothetical protein